MAEKIRDISPIKAERGKFQRYDLRRLIEDETLRLQVITENNDHFVLRASDQYGAVDVLESIVVNDVTLTEDTAGNLTPITKKNKVNLIGKILLGNISGQQLETGGVVRFLANSSLRPVRTQRIVDLRLLRSMPKEKNEKNSP